jgi:hypothetical protein
MFPIKRFLLDYRFVGKRRLRTLFDGAYYLRRYPDVAASGLDPFEHFTRSGDHEGRAPHPLFDPEFYRGRYPDVMESGVPPFLHFVLLGDRAHRLPHPLFDTQFYLASYPDLVSSRISPFHHFILFGDQEGRRPHPLFDPVYYRARNPDIVAAGIPPFRHFVETGGFEGRDPNPVFDCRYYYAIYPDAKRRKINPLHHYVMQPPVDRRHPHPLFDGAFQISSSPALQHALTDPLVDYLAGRSALVSEGRSFPARIPEPSRGPKARRPDKLARAEQPSGSVRPGVSLLLMLSGTDPEKIYATINSVRSQTYLHWELTILHEDHLTEVLAAISARLLSSEKTLIRTIAATPDSDLATESWQALAASSGEFVALLDDQDLLMPEALSEMMAALTQADADAAYCDHLVTHRGAPTEIRFRKPAWSPTFFRTTTCVNRLLVIRSAAARRIGGFGCRRDGATDYDFTLRLIEGKCRIIHVPKALCWRRQPDETLPGAAATTLQKIQAQMANEHLLRSSFPAYAEAHPSLPQLLRFHPKERTSYPGILAVVRGDRPRADIDYWAKHWRHGPGASAPLLVVAPGAPASGSPEPRGRSEGPVPSAGTLVENLNSLLNDAVAEFVLFIDPLVRPTQARWLDYLIMYAEQPDVAFVAPHLYGPGDLLVAGSAALDGESGLRVLDSRLDTPSRRQFLECDREVLAAAPGMLLLRRSALNQIGGLEVNYASVFFAFADASARAYAARYRTIAVASPIIQVPSDYQPFEAGSALDALLFTDVHRAIIAEGDPFACSLATAEPGVADRPTSPPLPRAGVFE